MMLFDRSGRQINGQIRSTRILILTGHHDHLAGLSLGCAGRQQLADHGRRDEKYAGAEGQRGTRARGRHGESPEKSHGENSIDAGQVTSIIWGPNIWPQPCVDRTIPQALEPEIALLQVKPAIDTGAGPGA